MDSKLNHQSFGQPGIREVWRLPCICHLPHRISRTGCVLCGHIGLNISRKTTDRRLGELTAYLESGRMVSKILVIIETPPSQTFKRILVPNLEQKSYSPLLRRSPNRDLNEKSQIKRREKNYKISPTVQVPVLEMKLRKASYTTGVGTLSH